VIQAEEISFTECRGSNCAAVHRHQSKEVCLKARKANTSLPSANIPLRTSPISISFFPRLSLRSSMRLFAAFASYFRHRDIRLGQPTASTRLPAIEYRCTAVPRHLQPNPFITFLTCSTTRHYVLSLEGLAATVDSSHRKPLLPVETRPLCVRARNASCLRGMD